MTFADEPFTLSPYSPTQCDCGRTIKTKGKTCRPCARRAGGKSRKGHTRAGAKVRSDGKAREDAAVEYDCEGESGPCGHVGCPMNLSLDVSDAGTITIYGTPEVPTMKVKAATLELADEIAMSEKASATIEARQAWMLEEWGGVCAAWIARTYGSLSQAGVASIMRIAKQAVEQEENRALRQLKGPAKWLYRIRRNPKVA